MRNGHGVRAADAHDASVWCGREGGRGSCHGVGAADAHDAGVWCGMAMARGS